MDNLDTTPPSPAPIGAGLGASAPAWTNQSKIYLHNVPWKSDYRDVPLFPGSVDRTRYFEGLKHTLYVDNRAAWTPPGATIRLTVTLEEAQLYNYIRVVNTPRWAAAPRGALPSEFYYFITECRYVASSTTEFVVQLDVWTTYSMYARYGRMHVDRSHLGIAGWSDSPQGFPSHLEAPEGLDVGRTMRTVATSLYNIFTDEIHRNAASYYAQPYSHPHFLVLSAGRVSAARPPSAEERDKAGAGAIFSDEWAASTAPSADQAYGAILPVSARIFTGGYLKAFLEDLQNSPQTAAAILSITAIPNNSKYLDAADRWNGWPCFKVARTVNIVRMDMRPSWRTDPEIRRAIPDRYRHLQKFYTYPFMAIELSYGSASRILYPEAWAAENAPLVLNVNPLPNSSEFVAPLGYGANKSFFIGDAGKRQAEPRSFWNWSDYKYRHFSDYLSMAIPVSSSVELPVPTHAGALALASTRRSREVAMAAADWTQAKSLSSADAAYQSAEIGVGAAGQQLAIGQAAAGQQLAVGQQAAMMGHLVGGAGGLVSSAAGGLVAGGPTGAAFGAAGSLAGTAVGAAQLAIGQAAAREQLAIGQSAASAQYQVGASATLGVAGINRDLAQRAARGDYELAIRGQHAAAAEMRLTPASVGGGIGDYGLLGVGETVITVKWKVIEAHHMRVVGEHWLRYGYATGRWWMPPSRLVADLCPMSRFTYIRASEARVYGGVPLEAQQVLQGLLERGVTIWSDIAGIAEGNTRQNWVRTRVTFEEGV